MKFREALHRADQAVTHGNPQIRRVLVYGFLCLVVAVVLGFLFERQQNAAQEIRANRETLARVQADRRLRLEILAETDTRICRQGKRYGVAIQTDLTAQRQTAVLDIIAYQARLTSPDLPHPAAFDRSLRLVIGRTRRVIQEIDVQLDTLDPARINCRMLPSRVTATAAVFSAPIPPSRSIGGASCRAVTPSGVICQWPRKPWAVGVTKSTVFVWRNSTVQYAHTNK